MVKIPVRKRRAEAGQAILLVVLGMSIFMLGTLGFIIDGSHLYAQRAMAQAAADAAAQAGIMSIFDGTTGAWGTYSGATTAGTAISCGATGMSTAAACEYAQTLNGFSLASDTVTVTPNPTITVCPSNACLSTTDSINLLQVTVQRHVTTTLMGLLGTSASTVKAVGIGAIVMVTSPTPLIVTHPTMAGALAMNGTTSIQICGGPAQSIQINSSNSGAYSGPSSGSVDLSLAGPLGTPSCAASGTGANFGVFGGPSTNPGNVTLGTLPGKYVSPSSWIQDPLAGVAAPSLPTTAGTSATCTPAARCTNICPGGATSCTEYTPGYYTGGISVGGTAVFDPGVYYMKGGGFSTKNTTVGMCPIGTGPNFCSNDATTVSGMVVYDGVSSPVSGTVTSSNCDSTGGFTIDTGSNDVFWGAGISASGSTVNTATAPASPYYGILFFEDRSACAHVPPPAKNAHVLGQGSGCFSLIGTVYITNTRATMLSDSSLYQEVDYHGTPCTGVANYGEIIVSQLTVKGTAGISMGLFPTGFLKIRQVALVD